MDYISINEGKSTAGKKPFRNSKNLKKNRRFKLNGGIIYIGHIPHGFYEDQMREYFGQFGTVLDTTVARSKKTGRSKGYGFVRFKDEDVAKIAAESMNNYLMYSRIIKCRYIPPEERVGNMFANKITAHNYPSQKNRKIELQNKSKALSRLNQETYLKRVKKKINDFKNFFEKSGIEFTFKLNDESSQVNEKKDSKSSLSNDVESKSGKETEDLDGVLEIDESDDEISFKTPPQVKKVIKKSNNSLIDKERKNNSKSKKIQMIKKSKDKTSLGNQTSKNKKNGTILESKNKMKESLKKSSTTKGVKKRLQKNSTDSVVSNVKKVEVNRHILAKSKTKKKERFFNDQKCKEEN